MKRSNRYIDSPSPPPPPIPRPRPPPPPPSFNPNRPTRVATVWQSTTDWPKVADTLKLWDQTTPNITIHNKILIWNAERDKKNYRDSEEQIGEDKISSTCCLGQFRQGRVENDRKMGLFFTRSGRTDKGDRSPEWHAIVALVINTTDDKHDLYFFDPNHLAELRINELDPAKVSSTPQWLCSTFQTILGEFWGKTGVKVGQVWVMGQGNELQRLARERYDPEEDTEREKRPGEWLAKRMVEDEVEGEADRQAGRCLSACYDFMKEVVESMRKGGWIRSGCGISILL